MTSACQLTKNAFTFRNHQAVDDFRNDMETVLSLLTCDLPQNNATSQSLENSLKTLVNSVTQVIEKHAPLQIASQRQKRIQKKRWLNKNFLKMIKLKQK